MGCAQTRKEVSYAEGTGLELDHGGGRTMMTEGQGDRLVNAEEAARILGLKVATVRKLTSIRELACVRPTGRRCVRYRVGDLMDLIRRRTQPERAGGRRNGTAPIPKPA